MSEEQEAYEARLEGIFGVHTPVYRPLVLEGRSFYVILGTLLAVLAAGVSAYIYQFQKGLAITGLNDTVVWGIYISSFVFFIGISHAGTLISAILRASHAQWRRPVTRIAEMITAFALMTGAMLPLIDLGFAEHIQNIVLHPSIESPLVWDMVSIGTYLTASLIYLWIPMIPDLARLRDEMIYPEGGKIRKLRTRVQKQIYETLAVGWTGTEAQKELLEKAMFRMMVIIIPVAISVHTVIGYLFSMNATRPGWHTSIFGPLFVAGAIYSGIAAIIVVMYVVRKIMNLERYLTDTHIIYLGLLMLAVGMVMIYFTISELLTDSYGNYTNEHTELLYSKYVGQYSPYFWFLMLGGFVIPIALVSHPRTRTPKWITIASALVLAGMYIERVLIVVPSLAVHRLPYEWGFYHPTFLESLIIAGMFAWFLLLMTIFIKLFPIIGLWEMEEAGEVDLSQSVDAPEDPDDADPDPDPEPDHPEIPLSA